MRPVTVDVVRNRVASGNAVASNTGSDEACGLYRARAAPSRAPLGWYTRCYALGLGNAKVFGDSDTEESVSEIFRAHGVRAGRG